MKKFLKNVCPWLPTFVLLMLAAFAVVRMQTVQAALIVQLNLKQDKEVYQTDKQNFVRELNLIHTSLSRIEGKLDNVIAAKPKTVLNPGRH